MAQQLPEKDNDKLKKTKKQQQFTALPDYPAERCPKQPDRIDMPLSMKFVKKRRIKMKRKYRAVLENGIFQLHNPKQTELNAFSIEYRIDLAKVVLLYDDQRLAVQLQKEVLLLYPMTLSVEKFRHWMHQHRLWSQQKAAEAGSLPLQRSDEEPAPRSPEGPAMPQQDNSDRNSIRKPKITILSGEQMATNNTDFTTDPTISSVYSNPMYEYLRAVHATQLAVLDVTSRNLEEQVQLAEEMKELHELLKKTLQVAASAVQKPPPASATEKKEKKPKDEEEDEEEEQEEGVTTAIPLTTMEEKK